MKILHQNIRIPACSENTIADAKKVFSHIDSDFKNWGLNVAPEFTDMTDIAVLEQDTDLTLAQIFTRPDEMCMTQAQIVEFCKSHKDLLNRDWYTFFLFKVGDEFFVAYVDVYGDVLYVDVRQLSYGNVWNAEYRLRIVVKQLALKNLESSPLVSQTLESAIEMVKEAGYQVSKIM